jgi:Lon-like ATP-dependent protease
MNKQLTIEQNIKEGIEGRPAAWYSDVFELVFPDVDQSEINGLWKAQLAKQKHDSKDEDD